MKSITFDMTLCKSVYNFWRQYNILLLFIMKNSFQLKSDEPSDPELQHAGRAQGPESLL